MRSINFLFGRRSRRIRFGLQFQRKRFNGAARNWLRKQRFGNVGYVIVPVSGSLPELAEPPRTFIERRLPLPAPPLSLQALSYVFRIIEEADNAKGIVILLRDFSADFGTIQSLRRMIERLKQAGKRVVVYTPHMSLRTFYVGAAANVMVVPPSAEFNVTGLQLDAFYFKDALAELGVEVDIVQISPYKTAGNTFSESAMTDAEREQYSWLLDDQYDTFTREIARDLNMSQETLKAWIDQAPFGVHLAQENGLVDAVAYDDELHWVIGERWSENDVKLITWRNARSKLTRKVRRRHDKFIGIVGVEGGITMRPVSSINPLAQRAYSADHASVSHILRKAEREEDMAALIVYVNSPGGDALASDLIWRDIDRISHKIPVLVYMGNVAASGGYYIAVGGQYIMAQPATLTGSIGVIMGRPSTAGLLQKLRVNQVSLKRGENAGLLHDLKPLTDGERALLFARIEESYGQFKQVVAKGRSMESATMDEVALGRVWTGNQAKQKQLIDAFGDLQDLIAHARSVADLPDDDAVFVPIHNLYASSSQYIVPTFADNELPTNVGEWVDKLTDVFINRTTARLDGRLLYTLPFELRFRD